MGPRARSSLVLERTLGDDAWRLPSGATHLLTTHDERWLRVVSQQDGTSEVALVDVHAGRELVGRTFTTPRVSSVAVSRDGSVFALAHDQGTVSLREGRTDALIREVEGVENPSVVPSLALSGSGSRLLIWNTSREPERRGVFVFDVATGERLLRAPVPGHAVLSLDGMTLVGGLEGPRRVASWDLSGAEPRALRTVTTRGWAWQYALAPDGDVVFGTSEGEVRRWSPREGVTRWVREDIRRGVHGLCMSADGARVILTTGYGPPDDVRVLDGRTGETLLTRPLNGGCELALAADGSWFAAVESGLFAVTALPGGERLDRPSGHVGPVQALTFTPDGRGVVSAASDGVRVWDLDAGDTRWTLEPPAPVESLVVTPDGRTLVALCLGSSVLAWDLATGAERSRSRTPIYSECTPITVSPDARYVLWATPRLLFAWDDSRRDATLWAWDLSSRDPVEVLGRSIARGGALHVGVTRDGSHAVLFTGARPWKVDLSKLRRVGRGRVPGRGRLVGADLDGDVAVGLWALGNEEESYERMVCELNLWDVEAGSTLGRPMRVENARLIPACHGGPVVVAVGRADGRDGVELIEARTRDVVGVVDLGPMNDRATQVVVAPDGGRVAVGSDRGVVRVFRRVWDDGV